MKKSTQPFRNGIDIQIWWSYNLEYKKYIYTFSMSHSFTFSRLSSEIRNIYHQVLYVEFDTDLRSPQFRVSSNSISQRSIYIVDGLYNIYISLYYCVGFVINQFKCNQCVWYDMWCVICCVSVSWLLVGHTKMYDCFQCPFLRGFRR